MPHVLAYVNSQYGLGHFRRFEAILIALELSATKLFTTILFGGVASDRFTQLGRALRVELPGLSSQGAKGDVSPVPEPAYAGTSLASTMRRRAQLIQQVIRSRPIDLVLIEYFPFSKQYLCNEVEAMLTSIKKYQCYSPFVVVSVRDFVTNESGFDRGLAEDFISRHCDRILVHADEKYVDFVETYGNVSAFVHKLKYTGAVVGDTHRKGPTPNASRRIVVSAGGGRDGAILWSQLAPVLSKLHKQLLGWEINVFPGPYCPNEIVNEIREWPIRLQLDGIILRPFDSYRSTASASDLSISMCGYNTAYELVALQPHRIIFLPRQRNEQLQRASLLQRLRYSRTAQNDGELFELVRLALTPNKWELVKPEPIALDGARISAEYLIHWLTIRGISVE